MQTMAQHNRQLLYIKVAAIPYVHKYSHLEHEWATSSRPFGLFFAGGAEEECHSSALIDSVQFPCSGGTETNLRLHSSCTLLLQ